MLAFFLRCICLLPGAGYGTLDEFTEIITLVQTKKIRPIPIVPLRPASSGIRFFQFFKDKLSTNMAAIDASDLELYLRLLTALMTRWRTS